MSTDKSKLNIEVIHKFLSEDSYWSKNIPFEIVKKGIENSLCFGVYFNEEQIGFARMITDYASFAYLADVFILPDHRGKGLSKWLMEEIMNYPDMQGLRRIMLATADAHELYKKFGFVPPSKPERLMEIHKPNVYQ
ncbi:MAG: GNAT family N-acetyltransferase [Ignavibacteria bacterium GWB2_35_6b]|nr:MAG: GNAT family N-acetyltransferase [Ignavibacteria bacterium GWB2_35_6b]